MIEIQKLKRSDLTESELLRLTAGYTSNECYRIQREESDDSTTISLKLVQLDEPYVKRFEPDDDEEYDRYCRYVDLGMSLGVYEDGKLQGLALTETVAWNKTLWIWEFHIAPHLHGQGLGRQMMEHVADLAKDAGLRVMVCETQNTNVPAIRFYRKVGFVLDGIDLSYYSNDAVPMGEVAIFMKRHL